MISRSFFLGLLFIVSVALIWAASSVFVKFLFNGDNENVSFHSPFLLTYIGVSLFTLWLPVHFGSTTCSKNGSINSGVLELPTAGTISNEYQSVSPIDSDVDDQEEASTVTWTNTQHLVAAMYIAPVWFIANWSYNASLFYTSITSSTVLASTGSIFTFLFAVCKKDEHFSWIKLTGVLLGVMGSVLTAVNDIEEGNNDKSSNSIMLGDSLGLISAIGYGAYATQTRLLCPHDESLFSMQLVLGYIGLFSLVAMSPMAAYVVWQLNNSVDGEPLTWVILGFLVIKGIFDNVISDYLWLRAVLLTSATIATVGLGLTIPLAFLSDVIMNPDQSVMSIGSVLGAMAVLGGFTLVTVGATTEGNSTPPATSLHDNSLVDENDNGFRQYDVGDFALQ